MPTIKEATLKELGVSTIEVLYCGICPDELRFKGTLNVPAQLVGELELKEHLMGVLNQKKSGAE